MATKTKVRVNPATNKPYTDLELAQAHIEALDARIGGFQDALIEIADNWKPLVHSLVGDLSTPKNRSVLRQLQFLASELRGQLNELRFRELAKKIVTGYDDSVAYATNTVEVVLGEQAKLSPLKPGILKAARELDLSAYEQIGNNAIRVLAKHLALDVAVGMPRHKIIAALDKVLDGEFTNKAKLYIDTATRQFDRTVTMETWTEAGINRFEYFGPKDNKNRPFCEDHVGKVYTYDQILKMNNDQSLPVITYGGGWRCRHTFQPRQK